MTLRLGNFGELLVTRQSAKNVLQVIDIQGDSLVLDLAGVQAANHAFADELGKGISKKMSLSNVHFSGANAYVQNSLEAGFATALAG